MPRIAEADLERVKRSTDLLALVRSRGVELKKHGSRDWIGRCPFHADGESPNLIVSPDKGLFHCMACGAAGNAIQFVQRHDGVSFRHAFEVLAHGQGFGVGCTSHEGPIQQSTVPKLPCPLALEADDVALMEQALAYYRERLQQTPAALEYLKTRGIEAAIEPFGLGFADRTLGLRLPQKNREGGEALRVRLQKLGLIRESGHEHFNGCVVFPIRNAQGQVTEIYGRKINDNLRPGTAYHLYLPGPHVGIFNRECLGAPEIILCEAVMDALSFWVNGIKNVTCIYGTEGFTEELLEALRRHQTQKVYLAYDRDPAGERAAVRDAEKLQRFGIECFRVQFPHGMDANEYARKVTPAATSLRLLVNAAQWWGAGSRLPVVGSRSMRVCDEPTLQGFGGLAAGNRSGAGDLSLGADLSQTRDLCVGGSDAAGGDFDPGKYCGGPGPAPCEGIPPVPEHRQGEPGRAGYVGDRSREAGVSNSTTTKGVGSEVERDRTAIERVGRSNANTDKRELTTDNPPLHVALAVDEFTGEPLPFVDYESLKTGVGWAPAPFVPAPYEEVQAAARAHVSSLAASVSSSDGGAAKEEKALEPADPGAPLALPAAASPMALAGRATVPAGLQPRGDAWFLDLEGREYRVGGLEKTLGTDSLKVVLRLCLAGQDRFHLDQVDLARDVERRRFIERAAEETGLTPDVLKRDLGRLLLAVEQAQTELLKPQETAAQAVTLTPEEREEALAWLQAPNLIPRLCEAFHQAGIIGEESNTLVAYLAGVSRKLERPLAIIIQSASAAGKTTLMDAVLSFFPEEERLKYSAMTGQSLYYLGETNLKHKILAVVEEAGAEKASYALKLLQSEGELTIASTGKDPQTGKMVTQEYHVEGPVMIFLTTTAIDLDEELQNRCLTLAVDETPEQTARIHRGQRERRTLAGLIAREERKDLLKKLRNAQRLLQPVELLNPYAPSLTFATGRTRNRRDHEKYLILMEAIALLHQHQRPRGQHRVNGRVVEFIEITLEDIALANQLAPEVLGRSLDELPPQTRRLLGHIRELMKGKRLSVVGSGLPEGAPQRSFSPKTDNRQPRTPLTFSRKELRDACSWSLTQVRVHLERLVELEYLAIRHGRLGSQFVYEILFDLEAPENIAHVGLIDLESLRAANLAGFAVGVAGQNGHLAGGGARVLPRATDLAIMT